MTTPTRPAPVPGPVSVVRALEQPLRYRRDWQTAAVAAVGILAVTVIVAAAVVALAVLP